MAASFFRSLGYILACCGRRWCRHSVCQEQRRGDAGHGCRRTRPDGHGHHLLHGHGQRCASQSRRHPCFRSTTEFSLGRVPGYIFAQSAGGIVAAFFLRATFGTIGNLGATAPGTGVSALQALAMEVLLSAGLVNTILGTASGARNVGSNGAIAVGGYIALAGLWAAPISGSSMNPVRSLAPDLVLGDFTAAWVYLVGPLTGAMIAVVFEWILKGPPTATGTIIAQGTLEQDNATPDRR